MEHPCPKCRTPMVLLDGPYGLVYTCKSILCPLIRRRKKKKYRTARRSAHLAFDRLWTEGHMTRSEAYAWMQRVLDLPPKMAHMSRMRSKNCQRVQQESLEYLRWLRAAKRREEDENG